MNQKQHDKLMMDFAERVSKESYCKRAQVGAILTNEYGDIISYGYNGTRPKIDDNCCEDENDVSYPYVIHAEDNVYRKLLKSPVSSYNSILYCTLLPCENCASIIVSAGTKRVVYRDQYKCDKGLTYLRKAGIIVDRLI